MPCTCAEPTLLQERETETETETPLPQDLWVRS